MGRIMDDPEITVGHAGWDHVATIIEVHWEQIGQMSRKRPKYDVMNPHNKAKLFDVLDHCPSPQWSMNASDHAVQLTQYFQDQLAEAFPAPKRKTPTYTREETRQIYQKTVVHKKSLGHFKILELFQILSRIFDAWAHKPHYEGSIRWRTLFNFKYAQTMAELQKSADILKAGLKADKNAFLDNLAKEVNECPPAEIFRRLRPVLQPAKKQAPVFRPLPKLLDAEGQPILSRQDQEARWTEHFASIEAGQVVQVEHFAEKHLQRQLERCKPAEYDIRDIPSLYAVESAIRSAKSGKTSGPDGIPIELFKALPGKAARILYPLALKLALRVEEPLTWKGGHLFALYKGKGPMAEFSSHRGILLMDVMGKVTRASLRKWINGPYLSQGHPMQLGGRPHQQAQFGAQLTRSFLRWRKGCNKSAAVLFVDIASAFYKALRQIATGADASDQDMAQIARRLGLGPELMPALYEALQGRTAYAALTESVPRQQVLQESLQATCFSVDGETIVGTEQGTRPGDSWADVVFNVLLSQVLHKVQRILDHENIVVKVPQYHRAVESFPESAMESIPLLQVTWADDIALMITVDRPNNIWEILPRVMQTLVDELNAVGMEISCGPSKTAALVLLRGPDLCMSGDKCSNNLKLSCQSSQTNDV